MPNNVPHLYLSQYQYDNKMLISQSVNILDSMMCENVTY